MSVRPTGRRHAIDSGPAHARQCTLSMAWAARSASSVTFAAAHEHLHLVRYNTSSQNSPL